MTIKEQIKHAYDYKYPVIVKFQGYDKKGHIVRADRRTFVMTVSTTQLLYNAVHAVQILAPEPRRADILDEEWEPRRLKPHKDVWIYKADSLDDFVCRCKAEYADSILILPNALRALANIHNDWVSNLHFHDHAHDTTVMGDIQRILDNIKP